MPKTRAILALMQLNFLSAPLSESVLVQRGRFRLLLGTLLAPTLWVQPSAWAAPPPKVVRIGYLSPGRADLRLLKPALAQLGYVEGKHVTFEERVGPYTEIDALAAELVATRPDLIVASTNPAVAALQSATRSVPVVMMWTADPVAGGFIQSLARPGGNITGTAMPFQETFRKLVQIGHELAPARVIGHLISPDHPSHPHQLKETESAAQRLGLAVAAFPVRELAGLDGAFKAAARAGVKIMVISAGPPFGYQVKAIAEAALRHRIGTAAIQATHVKAGFLFSYGMDQPGHYRDVAAAVDRIANGASAATLPVTLPTQFEFTINERTAQLLGIAIPPALQVSADMVR